MSTGNEMTETEWLEEIYSQTEQYYPIPMTGTSTLRVWSLITDPTMVRIQFPEPEGHWSFKWRMFRRWLKCNKVSSYLRALYWWLEEFPLNSDYIREFDEND